MDLLLLFNGSKLTYLILLGIQELRSGGNAVIVSGTRCLARLITPSKLDIALD